MNPKNSGNGSVSPFGDGKGSPPSGNAKGASDFVTNPKGDTGAAVPARDFTKENYPAGSLGDPLDFNPDSVPAGGRFAFPEPGPATKQPVGDGLPMNQVHKPFKGI